MEGHNASGTGCPLSRQASQVPPGTKFSYSNSGYILLGYILEKVSGQTYADFLQKNIFTPLAMYDTGVDSNTAILPKRVQGYVPSANGMQHAGYVSMTVPFSAGALYSTTGDLLKWEQGLFGGKVLNPASQTKMLTPFKDNYGFGLEIGDEKGHKRIQHNGGIEGFNTSLAYYPDDKLVVIVLGNLNGSAADSLAAKLAQVALGEQVVLPSERKEVQVPEKILQDYVGTYRARAKLFSHDDTGKWPVDDSGHRPTQVPPLRGIGDKILPESRGCGS